MKNVLFFFSALITAFEKSKKKYQSKMKKMECQLQAMAERYEAQVRAGDKWAMSREKVPNGLSHCLCHLSV